MENKKRDTPLAIQIIGILMCLGGAGIFLAGIPTLLFFGFGIILMVFGAAVIYFGMKVYGAAKSAYLPALGLGILALLNDFRTPQYAYVAIIIHLAFLGAIYYYRKDFVN